MQVESIRSTSSLTSDTIVYIHKFTFHLKIMYRQVPLQIG